MNWWYGGVPIIGSYTTAEEAQVPRNTEAEVREQIAQDLDDALTAINTTPAARGRIAKGAVLATKMREALYYGDWQKAKDAAQAIIDLKQYELDSDYENLFKLSGIDSKEIILADQRLESVFGLGVIGQMYNNDDAGWSSIVPTQNLVDMYEMDNGLTKEEATGYYDAKHPFANRDPRMDMTILYPGQEWRGKILNTLDEKLADGSKNKNFPTYTDNASKTALTWAKYLDPYEQYSNIWNTAACVIIFRYAEVLLNYAEAMAEWKGESYTDDKHTMTATAALNQVRNAANMPNITTTGDAFKESVRRERRVELAFEDHRFWDIRRWKIGEQTQKIYRTKITKQSDGSFRYEKVLLEERNWENKMYLYPIPLSEQILNNNLGQNPGW